MLLHTTFLSKQLNFEASLGEDTVVDPCQEYSEGWGVRSFNYESGCVNDESWIDDDS